MQLHSSVSRLTAILIVGGLRQRSERCLQALLAQSSDMQFDILIIDIAPQTMPLVGCDHPYVRCIRYPDCPSYATAKVKGIQSATTEVVAFIEDHAIPDANWVKGVLRAFQQSPDIASVVYTYKNLNPQTVISRAFMLFSYGRWMNPAFSGYVGSGPSNNIAYRRAVLLELGDTLTTYLDMEYVFHQRFQAQGWKMYKTAEAVIAHENWVRLLPGLRDIGVHSQFSAIRRVKLNHWSLIKRTLFIGGMTIFPLVQCWRMGKSLRPCPELFRAFLCYLPIFFLFSVYGAFKEAIGYMNTSRDLRVVVTDNELFIPRDV
ncbi:MAG: glycosyltransferase [Planctomycetes bacterium]|nr:glycosyltransferase [Planctomycetota bacterium]MBM4064402.1 glycosyltransferase [Planctomycetota bacterium]